MVLGLLIWWLWSALPALLVLVVVALVVELILLCFDRAAELDRPWAGRIARGRATGWKNEDDGVG